MRCWRCAKENQDGLIKCVVCASELNRKVEPWFCRTCFRRCLQESCSLCGSGREAGVAAASKAANSVVSREVTSKLRSRRYSKWIANAKQGYSKKPVFDLGNYDEVYSTRKTKLHTEDKDSLEEDKESTFEKLKNEILERNRIQPYDHSIVGNLEKEVDNSHNLLGIRRRFHRPKISQEEFVALLWGALQVVSMHEMLDHAGRVALRITSSMANLLPRPIVVMNVRKKFSQLKEQRGQMKQPTVFDFETNPMMEVMPTNNEENEADVTPELSATEKSALLASRARRRRIAKEQEHAKREELTSARQRRAASAAANLAAIALEQSRLPTPPTARHWFLLMKRSHFQKYGANRFLFKLRPPVPPPMAPPITGQQSMLKLQMKLQLKSPGVSRPQSSARNRSKQTSTNKSDSKERGGGEGLMLYNVQVTNSMNKSENSFSSASGGVEKTSGTSTPSGVRTPKQLLYGGRMFGEAAARLREKEKLEEDKLGNNASNPTSKKKLVIDVRGGGNAVNVVCCVAADLGWRVIKNKKSPSKPSLFEVGVGGGGATNAVANDTAPPIDDSDDSGSSDDDVSTGDESDADDDEEEEEEESDSDDNDSVKSMGRNKTSSSATAAVTPTNKSKYTSSSGSTATNGKKNQPIATTTATMNAPSTTLVTQSSFKTIGYADIVWLADYHVSNNLALNLTRHAPRRRLRSSGGGYAPSRADLSMVTLSSSLSVPPTSTSTANQPSKIVANKVVENDAKSQIKVENVKSENESENEMNSSNASQSLQRGSSSKGNGKNDQFELFGNMVLMNEFESMMLKYEKSMVNNEGGNNGPLLSSSIGGNNHQFSYKNSISMDNSNSDGQGGMVDFDHESNHNFENKWRRRWVNHFPGMNRAVSKANLGKELNRYLNLLSFKGKKAFQFFPKTFLLPENESEAINFLEYNSKNTPKNNSGPFMKRPSSTTSSGGGGGGIRYRKDKGKKSTKTRRSRHKRRSSSSVSIPPPSNKGIRNLSSNSLLSSEVIKEEENEDQDQDHDNSKSANHSQPSSPKKQSSMQSKDKRSSVTPQKLKNTQTSSKKTSKQNQRTLIIKPSNGSQGKGIVLVQTAQAVKDISFDSAATRYTRGGDEYVCQEYMSKPVLLNNLKFDLRIYVLLVASEDMDHVDAWLCEEGLARFATCPYEAPDATNLDSQFMHLTNYSLNKDSKDFIADGGDSDHKRPLTAVFNDLQRVYNIKCSTIWRELGRVAAHTISVISPQLLSSRRAFSVERERMRRQAKALKIFKAQKDVPPTMSFSTQSSGQATTPLPSVNFGSNSMDKSFTNDSMNKETTKEKDFSGNGGMGSGKYSRVHGSLSAVEGLLNKPTHPPMLLPCCFQIIGIDVMLVHDDEDDEEEEDDIEDDETGDGNVDDDISECSSTRGDDEEMKVKAILIEINSNPALSIGHKGSRSAVDEKVKRIAVSGALHAVDNWNARLKQKHNQSKPDSKDQKTTDPVGSGGGGEGGGRGEKSTGNDNEEEEEEFEIDGYFQIAQAGKWLGPSAIPDSYADDFDEFDDASTCSNMSAASSHTKDSTINLQKTLPKGTGDLGDTSEEKRTPSLDLIPNGVASKPLPENDQEFHRILDLVLDIRHCFEACAGTPVVCSTSRYSNSSSSSSFSASQYNASNTHDLAAILTANGCSEVAAEVASETWGGSSSLALSQLLAPGPEAGEEPRWQLSRNQFVQFGRRCLDPNSSCLATASLDALFAAVTKKGYLTARRMGAIDSFDSNNLINYDRSGRQHMNFSLFLDALINLSKLIHIKSPSSFGNNMSAKRRPSTTIAPSTSSLTSPSSASSFGFNSNSSSSSISSSKGSNASRPTSSKKRSTEKSSSSEKVNGDGVEENGFSKDKNKANQLKKKVLDSQVDGEVEGLATLDMSPSRSGRSKVQEVVPIIPLVVNDGGGGGGGDDSVKVNDENKEASENTEPTKEILNSKVKNISNTSNEMSTSLFRPGGVEAQLSSMVKTLHQRLFTAAKLVLNQDQLNAAAAATTTTTANNSLGGSNTAAAAAAMNHAVTTSTLRAVAEAVVQQKVKVNQTQQNSQLDKQVSFDSQQTTVSVSSTSTITTSSAPSTSRLSVEQSTPTLSRKASRRSNRKNSIKESSASKLPSKENAGTLPQIGPNRSFK